MSQRSTPVRLSFSISSILSKPTDQNKQVDDQDEDKLDERSSEGSEIIDYDNDDDDDNVPENSDSELDEDLAENEEPMSEKFSSNSSRTTASEDGQSKQDELMAGFNKLFGSFASSSSSLVDQSDEKNKVLSSFMAAHLPNFNPTSLFNHSLLNASPSNWSSLANQTGLSELTARLAPGITLQSLLELKSTMTYQKRVGHPYQNRNPPKRKKPRTSFNRPQIVELEKRFMKQKYLASSERSALAKVLKMTDAQVKTWFQNRRTKWRRQTSEQKEAERQAAAKLLNVLKQQHQSVPSNDLLLASSSLISPSGLLKGSTVMASQRVDTSPAESDQTEIDPLKKLALMDMALQDKVSQ